MAVKEMTREEYEKKYGVASSVPVEATQQTSSGGIGGTLGGFAKGLGQSIATPLQNIGKTAIKAATFGKADTSKLGFPQEALTPKTTSEKVGKFTGDVAQFAVPIGRVAKGVGLAGRVATEGAISGGLTAAQSGNLDKSARDAAILGSIFPSAGKITSATKVKIGGRASERIINSLIKPLKKDFAYGKNPGRAVAQEGIIASSLDDLETQIGQKLTTRLSELEATLGKSKSLFDLSKITSPLDEAMNTAVKQNNPALLSRIEKAKQALTQNLTRQVDEETGEAVIKSSGARNLIGLSAKEATQLKREIGEMTAFSGNPSDDKLVNSALKRAYGVIKGEIEKKVPNSKQLNERIADLIGAKTATKYREDILERQNMAGFNQKILGTMGVVGTVLTGGNPLPVLLGLGAAGLEKALGTPKAKTEIAQWLVKATPNEKSLLFKSAPWAKGVLQKALFGAGGEAGPDSPPKN